MSWNRSGLPEQDVSLTFRSFAQAEIECSASQKRFYNPMSAIASASHVTPAVWRRRTCPVGKHDKVIALARGPEPSRGKKTAGQTRDPSPRSSPSLCTRTPKKEKKSPDELAQGCTLTHPHPARTAPAPSPDLERNEAVKNATKTPTSTSILRVHALKNNPRVRLSLSCH